MTNPDQIATQILAEADNVLKGDEPDLHKLARLWHTLTFLRARVITTQLKNAIGLEVYSGPFKGMKLPPEITNKVFGPILTGCYEQELHPAVEKAIARNYRHIVNIGSGFGYYTTGFARRMPKVQIHGFDTDEGEQKISREMAALNGVKNRVEIGGEFRGEDFEKYAGQKTLLIVDIEGAEKQLLDPARYPALTKMDMIVELHDVNDPSISKTIIQRFAPTHEIEIVPNNLMPFDFTPLAGPGVYVDPLDRFAINWENRGGPTPWAVMWAERNG